MSLFTKSSSTGSHRSPAAGNSVTQFHPSSQCRRARRTPRLTGSHSERHGYLQQLKLRIHAQLVEKLDLQNMKNLPAESVRSEMRNLVRDLCTTEKSLISSAEQEKLIDEVLDETFGLGPLEQLLKDPAISDILINRFDRIYIERKGRLELSEVCFRDNKHLRQIIDRIVARVGRRVDEISPMVDARLADGSRVNAIIPPLALDGPAMSIRRFGSKPLQAEDLVRHGGFSERSDRISLFCRPGALQYHRLRRHRLG